MSGSLGPGLVMVEVYDINDESWNQIVAKIHRVHSMAWHEYEVIWNAARAETGQFVRQYDVDTTCLPSINEVMPAPNTPKKVQKGILPPPCYLSLLPRHIPFPSWPLPPSFLTRTSSESTIVESPSQPLSRQVSISQLCFLVAPCDLIGQRCL